MAARWPGATLPLLFFIILFLHAGVLAEEQPSSHDACGGGGGLRTTGRTLAQVNNSSDTPRRNISDGTARVDPLDNFRKYRGGFDITNKHYWSSVIFTGIHGYAIAVLWLLLGVLYCTYRALASCCVDRRKIDAKQPPPPLTATRPRIWPGALVILLTLFVVIACCVALGGSSRFHSSARSIRKIISHVAGDASATVSNITGAVSAMTINQQAFIQIEKITHLNATSQRLTKEAAKIHDKADKSVNLIGKGLKILQASTTVIVALNLVTVLALLGSRFLRLNRTLRTFLILCWLLISFFWLFFGLYFFLGRFAGDTCKALEDYKQDPRNSSLSSILPCSNQSTAHSALKDTRAGIHHLINKVNANISAMAGPGRRPPGLICNPFSPWPLYTYQPERCLENTTKIGDIPQVLRGFTCSGPEEGSKCAGGQFISAEDFNTISIYTGSIQTLLDTFPSVERIANCQLVMDAFSQVLFNECRPLKKYAKMSWASMAAASTITVLLSLTWVVLDARAVRRRKSEGSVVPRDHSPGSTPDRVEMTGKGGFPRPEP